MNNLEKALPKLDKIFDVAGIPEESKKQLIPTLVDAAVLLAGQRIAKARPDLKAEIDTMDTDEPDISGLIDDDTKNLFVEEIVKILDEYIVELVKTVDTDKKKQIFDIWER